jgi:hypothetical protein
MAKTPKLPKRVAGVKLPKSVRKSGGKVQAMFASPMARSVIEKLISAALIAFTAKLADSAAARDAGAAVKDKAGGAARKVAAVVPGKRAPARRRAKRSVD